MLIAHDWEAQAGNLATDWLSHDRKAPAESNSMTSCYSLMHTCKVMNQEEKFLHAEIQNKCSLLWSTYSTLYWKFAWNSVWLWSFLGYSGRNHDMNFSNSSSGGQKNSYLMADTHASCVVVGKKWSPFSPVQTVWWEDHSVSYDCLPVETEDNLQSDPLTNF